MPNASGRGMLDGETAVTDLNLTETNRSLVATFVQKALVERQLDLFDDYVAKDLIQHDPEIPDGVNALRAMMESSTPDGRPLIAYRHLHRVLAEGNFVLCMSEGTKTGVHSGLYDLFRVADQKIVERWNTISKIAPADEWKNQNGKF